MIENQFTKRKLSFARPFLAMLVRRLRGPKAKVAAIF